MALCAILSSFGSSRSGFQGLQRFGEWELRALLVSHGDVVGKAGPRGEGEAHQIAAHGVLSSSLGIEGEGAVGAQLTNHGLQGLSGVHRPVVWLALRSGYLNWPGEARHLGSVLSQG